MAHELGHISAHDPSWSITSLVSNIFVTGFFVILKFFVKIIGYFTFAAYPRGFIGRLIAILIRVLYRISSEILEIATGLWNKLMQVLINWSLREDEFYADLFAYNMGYGIELCRIIEGSAHGSGTLKELLLSPYQDPYLRIKRLQEAGCTYTILANKGESNE